MKARSVSIPKFREKINEDAVFARNGLIAVSDGAGGGGVFADQWSRYLVDNLPNEPIFNFSEFDLWLDNIWEKFYNEHEELAKAHGGLFLNKFYDEGSFATLVAVWKVSESECRWISYGDSVAFCYDRAKGELQHSFSKLADFNNPPYLVNCKDPLDEKGFRCGTFKTSKTSVVFCASDALSHLILMLYETWLQTLGSHRYDKEIEEAINTQTRNSQYIKLALDINVDFDLKMKYFLRLSKNKMTFQSGMTNHRDRLKLVADDDYSLAVMDYNEEAFIYCTPLIIID
jgi:hypothetical protein